MENIIFITISAIIMSALELVLGRSKEYEYLVTEFDPAYDDLLAAIAVVKKFIIDNGLIVYGGTSIDYALRLFGDKIYPDDALKVPDLDFYSYDNVKHSYELADILYSHGWKEARAINAQHMETMRVDLVDNHFIADITYRPLEVFKNLPSLEYNGMKIIHPLFQRIDVHSSLSFPYDDVPREVIFARWDKDIKRFNKLDQYYPVVASMGIPLRKMTIPATARKYIWTGFLAYALVYSDFVGQMHNLGQTVSPDISAASFSADAGQIIFDTLDQRMEIVHFNIMAAAGELGLSGIKMYEPYVNLIPKRIEGANSAGGNICIYSTKNRLISANSIKLPGGDMSVRVTNVQYLLKYFLSMYFVTKINSTEKISEVYLARYVSLLRMIQEFETAIASRPDRIELATKSPLFPIVRTYGNENINLARKIALNYLHVDLDGVEQYKIPRNYYPGRSRPKGIPHPQFDPEEIKFFRELGRIIPPEKTTATDTTATTVTTSAAAVTAAAS